MNWIAFTMGLVGSLHCLGMCGPLALSVPVSDPTPVKRFVSVFLYNTGRVSVYSTFGFVAGLLGEGIVLAGYQQVLSVAAGIIILLFLVTPLSSKVGSIQAFGWFRSIFATIVKKRTHPGMFLLGLINGMLPCGMVYMAVAGAVSTGSAVNGALFMAAFGAGTFPMMASITYMASYVSHNFRNTVRKAFPYMMAVMAVLLVVRGLNLGIPYLSPKATDAGVYGCCHNSKSCKP